MKLTIQIPCHNEEKTLPLTVGDLPRSLNGIDQIEYLIIDDGSTDGTVEVAENLGVHHIHRLPRNRGLARAFSAGLTASLRKGADIIVNTDGDNQYAAADIGNLIEPILKGEADMVVGERPISEISHFSPAKKMLQRLGSWVVRLVSGTEVPDATSGFRAFSRDTAMRLNVFSSYTYTLETLIQAGHSDISVATVPIRTNEKLRDSRLISSVTSYIRRSVLTMIRMFLLYKPLRLFVSLGSTLFLGGFLIAVTMEKWNLHRRIALTTIRLIGVAPNRIVLGFMLATAFLSMWISNTATTMMMLPYHREMIKLFPVLGAA